MRNKDSDTFKKFLLIINIIKKYSDENHLLTFDKIKEYINEAGYDFKCDTRTIKKYVDYYNEVNDDYIDTKKISNKVYFYYTYGGFEVMDAKAIVDLVYSSDFFTANTKSNYKDTICHMFSDHYKHYFDKNIVFNIEKNANEKVFYNELEKISEAIYNKKMISFTYSKPMIENEDIRYVEIAPIDTVFNNNVYYLICQNNDNNEEYKTYRLDYISDVTVIEDSNVFIPSHIINSYNERIAQSTYMYQKGKSEVIELEFDESVYPNIIDKFGKDIKVRKASNGRFRVNVKNIINSTFYAWLVGFDGKITIYGSEKQIKRFNEYLKSFIKEI